MIRFLRYSLEKKRRIRAVVLLEDKMLQQPVTVLALSDNSVTMQIGRRKAPDTLPLSDILSCDYARGDDGSD